MNGSLAERSQRTINVGTFDGEPIDLAVLEAGDSRGTAVVLCHGFPDLGRTWSHQISALAEAGFRAIAPDQRGYGGSSAPDDATAYGLGELCGDLVGLLDALDIERAIFVGHDWGGFVAWAMPVLHPDRCLGAAGVCTPYMAFPSTAVLSQLFPDPDKMYMLWFQQPGVAEAVLDAHRDAVFSKMFVGGIDPVVLMQRAADQAAATGEGPDLNPFRNIGDLEQIAPSVLSAQEQAIYSETFARTGFRGGVSWYRNLDRNAESYPQVGTAVLDLPTLMICSEWDPVLSPAMAAGMPALCTDLEITTVEKTGHFVQLEDPEAVSQRLVDWLTKRFPPGDATI